MNRKVIWAVLAFTLMGVFSWIFFGNNTDQRSDMTGSLPNVNEDSVWADVLAVTSFVPRHAGTDSHRQCVEFIAQTARSRGAKTTVDTWTEYTKFGDATFSNIIAEIPGKDPSQFIIVGSHFDTKQGIPGFVGANDGASSTGALLAMIGALKNEVPPVTLRFVFFDGEECFHQYDIIDGLHGSRRYANQLVERGEVSKCRAMILLDMIGDKDLTLTLSSDTHPGLLKRIQALAAQLGQPEKVTLSDLTILDDHVPFQRLNIPSIDLIDFEYGPNNVYWHTAADTLDKLSPQSLSFITTLAFALIWDLGKNPT